MPGKGPLPNTRAFELIDPRDPDLPRYIGHGSGDGPWRARWELRNLDGSRLGGWFRQLDEAGVLPLESCKWLPRVAVQRSDAKRLARARIEQVARWAGTWPALPSWLLCDHFRRPHAPNKSLVPVVRLHRDGAVERFPSMTQAARARGWSFETVRYLVTSGHSDDTGSLYLIGRREAG